MNNNEQLLLNEAEYDEKIHADLGLWNEKNVIHRGSTPSSPFARFQYNHR